MLPRAEPQALTDLRDDALMTSERESHEKRR